MSDTLGSLIDKLFTATQKMFYNQEVLYEVRRMSSFEEFRVKYFSSEDDAKKLWEMLKKACDLNVQRSVLIGEIDSKIIEMIEAKIGGHDLDDGVFIQRQHKTY